MNGNMIALDSRGGSLQAAQTVNGDLLTRFISFVDAKPRTIETYGRAIRQFFAYMESVGTTQPTREDVISYRESLRENHKPATIQAYITALRLFFRWTAQEGLYPNIADHVKGAKISREHKRDYLTGGQVQEIMGGIDRSTTRGLRDYAIFALAVTGGLRTIEITRADVADMRPAGGEMALYIQGKGRDEKAEYVKLAQPVERAIRDYLQSRGDATGPLFTSTSRNNAGERMTTRSVSAIIKDCMKAAGYDSDRLTAHSLRHTAATLNLLGGGSLEETQQLLRHENISTTMIYAHALERANNRSEARIASAIFN